MSRKTTRFIGAAPVILLLVLWFEGTITRPDYLRFKASVKESINELALNIFAEDSGDRFLVYSDSAQIGRLLNWNFSLDSETRIQELKQWRYFNRLGERDTERVYENLLALSDRFISPVRDERRMELEILIKPLEIRDRTFSLGSVHCSRYWTRRLDYTTLFTGTPEKRRKMYKELPPLPRIEFDLRRLPRIPPPYRPDYDVHYALLRDLIIFESDRENRLMLIRKMHEGGYGSLVKKGELFEATDYCGETRMLMFNEDEIRQREQEMVPYIVGSKIPQIDELSDHVVYSRFDENNRVSFLEEAAGSILSGHLGLGYTYHYLSKLRGKVPQEVRLQAWVREDEPSIRKELLHQWLSEQGEIPEEEWAKRELLKRIEQYLQESIAKRIDEIDREYEQLPRILQKIQSDEERLGDSFPTNFRNDPLELWVSGESPYGGRKRLLQSLLAKNEIPEEAWTKSRASEILERRSQKSIPQRMAELDEVYELLPERYRKVQADKDAFEKAINEIGDVPEDSIIYELIAPRLTANQKTEE